MARIPFSYVATGVRGGVEHAVAGATVTFYEADGTTLLAQSLWNQAVGGSAQANPTTTGANGATPAFWLDTAQTIVVKWTALGWAGVTETLQVGASGATGVASPAPTSVPLSDTFSSLDAWIREHSFKHTAAAPTGVAATDSALAEFASPTSGFIYQLQAGTYVLNPTAFATASVTYLGVRSAAGSQTTIQLANQGGGSSTYIASVTAAGIAFEDIVFDGNKGSVAAGTNNYWSGLIGMSSGAKNVTFRRCTVQNTARGGIYANGYAGAQRINGLTVEDCRFSGIGNLGAGQGGAAIMLDGGCNDYILSRNRVSGVMASNFAKIVLGELPSNVTTYTVQSGSTATSIIANGTPFTAGALVDVAYVRFFTGTLAGQVQIITANTNTTLTTTAFSTAPTAGDTFRVWLPCAGGLVDSNVLDYRANTTFDATYSGLGIELFNGAWNTRCSRNQIYGPDVAPAAGHFWAISCGDARGSIISENVCIGSPAAPQAMAFGIEVAECPSIALKGNRVRYADVGSNFTNNNPLPSHSIIIEGDNYENCYSYGLVSDSAPSAFKLIGLTMIDCGTRYVWHNSANAGGGNGTVKDGVVSACTFQIRDQTRLDGEGLIFAYYVSSANESDVARVTFADCNVGPYPGGLGTVGLTAFQANKPRGIKIHHCNFDGARPSDGAAAVLKAIKAFSGDIHVDHCTVVNFTSATAALCTLSATAAAPLSTFEYNIVTGGSNTHGVSNDANTPFSVTWWDANGHLRTIEYNVNGVTAPTAAAGANNGTTPPAPVVDALSKDAAARLTFGSGTGPAAGAQVVVTYHQPYVNAPMPLVVANNAATAALQPYISGRTTTTVTISTVNAPTAAQANTVYDITIMTAAT